MELSARELTLLLYALRDPAFKDEHKTLKDEIRALREMVKQKVIELVG